MSLPDGLDVYEILWAALDNPTYRDKLLTITATIFSAGFFTGIVLLLLIYVVFSKPDKELAKKDRN